MRYSLKTLFLIVTLSGLLCGYFCLPLPPFLIVTALLFVIVPTLIVTEIVYGRGPLCGFAVGSACSLGVIVPLASYFLFTAFAAFAQGSISLSGATWDQLVWLKAPPAVALALILITGLIGVSARAMGIRRRKRWEAEQAALSVAPAAATRDIPAPAGLPASHRDVRVPAAGPWTSSPNPRTVPTVASTG